MNELDYFELAPVATTNSVDKNRWSEVVYWKKNSWTVYSGKFPLQGGTKNAITSAFKSN